MKKALKMKIVCLGDSITRGVSYVKGRLRIIKGTYPSILQDLFSNEKDTNVIIVNKGVFNDNTDSLLSRLEKDVIEGRPDYAIIGIGGNDCNFKWNEVNEIPMKEHQAIVPLDRYLDNVKKVIKKLQQESIVPIVLSLPPLEPVRFYNTISKQYGNSIDQWVSTIGGIEHWHGLYNRGLKKMINELKVYKIDIRTALKNEGDLLELISEDGIHLTPKGYKVVGFEIYQYLKKIIKKE
jgi:lysophospholipase L1-like esterase